MSAKNRKRKPAASNANCSRAPGSASLVWSDNGFLTAPDGTSYCVQRESWYGAQTSAGGWIFYLLRKRPGEHRYETVGDTQRTRESSVRRIAERMARLPNDQGVGRRDGGSHETAPPKS